MAAKPDIRFFKNRDGVGIAYSCIGEGPTVICPAWWVSHVEKDWNIPGFGAFFTRLAEGLSVVRYDRPGVGLSDRAAHPPSLADEADLVDDLVEELGAERYSLFAISCGGPPAIVHAANSPEQVDRLCFYGSYAQGQSICSVEVQNAVHATVKAHWGLGARAMADIFLPDEDRQTLLAFAKQQRQATDVDTAANLLRLTYEMDATDRLGEVQAETLVMHRSGDRAIPFERARELAKGIKRARLVTFEGRSHPPWIQGESIARLANSFLRGVAEATMPTSREEGIGCSFDRDNRSLVIEGSPVALTPLEFGLMEELIESRGTVVTRDHLLSAVWKQPFEGSNRIDAMVRGLRRKLGAFAASIETVKGHGYRFTGWKKAG